MTKSLSDRAAAGAAIDKALGTTAAQSDATATDLMLDWIPVLIARIAALETLTAALQGQLATTVGSNP